MRIPGYRAAEVQVDCTERQKILGTDAERAVFFTKGTLQPFKKIGKERVHRKELFTRANFNGAVLVRHNSRIRHRKKTLQQEPKSIMKHKETDKSYLLLVGTRRTLQGTPLRRCSTSRDGVRLGKTHSTAQWTGEDSSTSRYVAWQYKNG